LDVTDLTPPSELERVDVDTADPKVENLMGTWLSYPD